MGNCQDQFQNVPDDFDEFAENQEYLNNSIKPHHKSVRPATQEIVVGVLSKHIQNNQLDRQQLHQTIRPFKEPETVELAQTYTQHLDDNQARRQELDMNFYHQLALPQYSYQQIPDLYANEFKDVQMYEQEDKNGVKYVGQWKNHQIHGNGVLRSNTVKYIGQFMYGLKHFHGRQIEKYEVYEGQFFNGRRKGKGIRYTPDLEEEGVFDEHLIEGVIQYKNGDIYEGGLENQKYQGHGKLTTEDGTVVYEGKFQHGKMEGKAIISYSDGKIYKGDFHDGLKHGKGYFQWDQKNFYDGEYLRGKKHGRGVLMRDGIIYEGTFKNGVMDGKMFIYEPKGEEKLNPRTQEYVEGTRVNDYQESVSEDMPEHWKSAICS